MYRSIQKLLISRLSVEEGDFANESVITGVDLGNSGKGPFISWGRIFANQNNIINLDVRDGLVPLLTLLLLQTILSLPSEPELVSQELNSAPSFSGVQIWSREVARRG